MAEATGLHTLKGLLTKTSLGDLINKEKRVVCFEHDTPIGTILATLARHKIIGGPIVCRPDFSSPGSLITSNHGHVPVKSVLGFVDVGEILGALLEGETEESIQNMTSVAVDAKAEALCERDVLTLFGPEATAAQIDLVGFPVTDRPYACSDWALKGNLNSPLLIAIRDGFLKHPYGLVPCGHVLTHPVSRVVHRLAVYDCCANPDNGPSQLIGILSQSDVVRFLHKHASCLGVLASKSVGDLFLRPHKDAPKLVCINAGTKTLEAFWRMYREGVSGVAVVDDAGRLVGNLSNSDLRCLALPGFFSALMLPLKSFLDERPLLQMVQREVAKMRASEMGGLKTAVQLDVAAAAGEPWLQDASGFTSMEALVQHDRPPPLLTVQPESSLQALLAAINEHRVHRVYVVDASGSPSAVITLTDVLRVISETCS